MSTDKKYYYLSGNDLIQIGDEFQFGSIWEPFQKDSTWIGWEFKKAFTKLNIRRLIQIKYNKFDTNQKPNWK